jgi:hypothetical protein
MFFTINKKMAGSEVTPEQTGTQPQLLNTINYTLPENSEIATPVEETFKDKSTQFLNTIEYNIPENYNEKITESTLNIDISSFSEDEKETLRNLHKLILSKTPKVMEGLKLFVSLNKMSGGATKKKNKQGKRKYRSHKTR